MANDQLLFSTLTYICILHMYVYSILYIHIYLCTYVTHTDLPIVTDIRGVSTICVTYFDISWVAPSITCEDVSYNVLISQSQIEGDAVEVLNVTGLTDRLLSVTGLNNSLPDVTITVTAIDRVGRRNDIISDLQLRISESKFV